MSNNELSQNEQAKIVKKLTPLKNSSSYRTIKIEPDLVLKLIHSN